MMVMFQHLVPALGISREDGNTAEYELSQLPRKVSDVDSSARRLVQIIISCISDGHLVRD
jgi:hypothetical protein